MRQINRELNAQCTVNLSRCRNPVWDNPDPQAVLKCGASLAVELPKHNPAQELCLLLPKAG
jgi:hypothetical protein